jgi:hypothetical protein
MKTNCEREVIARFVRGVWALGAVLALMISGAGVSRAQSQNAAPKPAPASDAASARAAADGAPPSGLAVPKGESEGIKVHGHWTIEVKNPDGKVVTHREFENSLAQYEGISGGADLLTGMISGTYTPGVWLIDLEGNPGPCSQGGSPINSEVPVTQTCEIVSPSANFFVSAEKCSTSLASASPQPFCYATMTETLSGSQNVFTSFTLSGSAYADTSTTITSAATYVAMCEVLSPGGTSPGTVVTPSNLGTISPSACLTSNAIQLPAPFTWTSLPGTGVQVTAGQTIDATVTISFQ